MAVKLMIDSASDISEKEAQYLGVILVPMTINFGNEEYLDGVNLLPADFYEKLTSGKVLPKTSQISAYRWEEEYAKHTKNGDQLVVITISSRLSATFDSAKKAAESYAGKVYVVDSMNACVGERLLGLYALRLIKEGKGAKEIAEELDEIKSKINIMAVIDTLEYLKKGGRISSVAAFAGKLLSLKPLVALIDGEVKMIGKALGSKKAYEQLNKLALEKGEIDFDMPHAFLWSGMDKSNLEKYIDETEHPLKGKDIPTYILGGTIGTHVGPGAVGLAFFVK